MAKQKNVDSIIINNTTFGIYNNSTFVRISNWVSNTGTAYFHKRNYSELIGFKIFDQCYILYHLCKNEADMMLDLKKK